MFIFPGYNAPGKPNQAPQSEERNGERLYKVILNLGMLSEVTIYKKAYLQVVGEYIRTEVD